jgi:dipeptidyl aminopeptidase/acylaminoacyl peptidase
MASLQAQQVPLQPHHLDVWERITSTALSPDGRYAAAVIAPQVGDGRAVLYASGTGQKWTLNRVDQVRFDALSQRALVRIPAPASTIRKLKKDKVKTEDLPKAHYAVVDLATRKVDTLGRAASCSIPLKAQGVVAWTAAPYTPGKKKDPKKPEGNTLFVRNLSNAKTDTLARVKSFVWAEEAAVLLAWQAKPGKNKGTAKVWRWTPGGWTLLDQGMEEVAQLAVHPKGTHLAWVHTTDTAKAAVRQYKLSGYTSGKTKVWLESGYAQLPPLHEPSPHEPLVFTDNERWLLLGYRPIPKVAPKDTLLDEEKFSLDLWSWNDPRIQPMQNVEKKEDEKRTFLGRISLSTLTFKPVESPEWADARYDAAGYSDWAVRIDQRAYEWSSTFASPVPRDAEALNLASGRRVPLGKGLLETPRVSPSGRYAFAWNPEQKNYQVWNLADSSLQSVTEGIRTPLFDEEHDIPQVPPAYGVAGFTRKDSLMVVYDGYDLWACDPTGARKPTNLTAGKGRTTETRWRVVLERPDQRYLEETPWLVSWFHEPTKSSGYGWFNYRKGTWDTLVYGAASYTAAAAARTGTAVVFRKERVDESSNLYLVAAPKSKPVPVAQLNPQQSEFRWPEVRLVRYHALGRPLEGLLFTPKGAVATGASLPLVVYFYERNADELHRYRAPAPSASTVNIPYFVSRGYAVFVPDIAYETGKPGPSALACIQAGVDAALASDKRLDPKRMALQGQSWGGYQTAYLITQTDRYLCAMAGAPVSNMTSAYGGIRYGTGMSRQFQYERTQSRLGKTLWEDRQRYIDNSPVFFANQVRTPLLIMHNDKDGAVPFTQGVELYMALRRNEKPVWMLTYNGEDHNLTERPNRMDLTVRMQQFFDHYLLGSPAPAWMVNGQPALEKNKRPTQR